MKAVPWCLSWMLVEIALTAGSPQGGEHLARRVCCEVGKQRALTIGNCNLDALEPHNYPDISDHVCRGFMRHCCRKTIKEKECEAGKDHALAEQVCEDLASLTSQECCATCKIALGSPSCEAEWLSEDDLMLPVFQTCCQLKPANDPQDPTNSTESNLVPKRPEQTFTILCREGYAYNEKLQVCEDIDECASDGKVCPEDSKCQNTLGSYDCTKNRLEREPRCEQGHVYSKHLKDCVDADECGDGTHTCKRSEDCVNLEDLDDCKSRHACSDEEICVNRGGHYMCVPPCKKGFKIDPVSVECIDIDECATKTHSCGDTQECVNSEGSFECRESNLVESCEKGYRRSATGDCKDIDECAMNSHSCLDSQQCGNTDGGFLCSERCDEGFALNGAGLCEDVDECATIFPCDKSTEVCTNTKGSFICGCKSGFERREPNTKICSDIDECKRSPKPCGDRATCVNTVGSFSCFANCGDGYHHVNGTCIDINECDNPGVCEHECRNTIGSYYCKCKEGFQPDKNNKAKCVDINECSLPGRCPGLCENTHGSFKCTCPQGYEMKRNSCFDVDECATPFSNNCRGSETCLNIGGGFRCLSYSCPTNYTRDNQNAMRCIRDQACEGQERCSLDPDLIIFNHIPSTRSNSRRPLSVRITGETDVYADFSLHVTKVIAHKVGLKEATDDNVELKARRTTAKIIVRQPIVGPQDVHMTLKAKLYKFKEWSTVADEIFKIVEWRVILYVPAYDL